MTGSPGEPEYFGEFLARARTGNDITWTELASAAGISISTLQRWLMRGTLPRSPGPGNYRTPPAAVLRRVSEVLGCPEHYVTACWQKTLEDCYPPWRTRICRNGHHVPPDAPCCPECEQHRREVLTPAWREGQRTRYATIACSSCGALGVVRIRARLAGGQPQCGRCYNRDRYRSRRQKAAAPYKALPSASGYRGVTLVPAVAPKAPPRLTLLPRPPSRDRWTAVITHEGRRYYLGSHATPEDAARAYDAKARELKGSRACLNFPQDYPGNQAKRAAS